MFQWESLMTPHAHDPATTRPDKGAVSNHQPSPTVWPVPYVRQLQKFYMYMLQVDAVSEGSLFRSQTADLWTNAVAVVKAVRKSRKNRSARKGEKSRQTLYVFQCFVAPEGRKVGSLKRRVRSHLVR